MADAVRLISIRRGYDPREFALVVFGGAGALHGAALAKELSIPTVLVPPNPGITSALGCLLVDVRHDLSEMYLRHIDDAEPGGDRGRVPQARGRGARAAARGGRAGGACHLQRTIAMRYLGQWRSLSVEIPERAGRHAALVAQFHEEHEREFAYRARTGRRSRSTSSPCARSASRPSPS